MKNTFRCLQRLKLLGLTLALLASAGQNARGQETVCATVKIEIKQELTLERQAFDAEMRINNALENASLTEVDVAVKVLDEAGNTVPITGDANDINARFFIRVSGKQNINDISGGGSVGPSSTAVINWLLIPAPGAAGNSVLGKKYLVGATLKYKFGAETHTLDVSPAVVTVKPLPLLTLDYFLTRDVVADDPLTTTVVEPPEPFTLGVRIKNTGAALAKAVRIDSAQPRIVENEQGLLIQFRLNGSYVGDAPVANTLLINFGDILPGASKMGRWLMETNLAGRFVEFNATFSHADELGGALTSILQATNAHFLVHDVRVDLPGRDFVRDFLAQDGDVLRVYESDGADTVVVDRSEQASIGSAGQGYRVVFPAAPSFSYVKLRDPFGGTQRLKQFARSDGKVLAAENVWLSRTKKVAATGWDYWLNIFDANSTGVYDITFQAPPPAARPPALQFIPDRAVKETEQVSFIVEGSSPDGKPVTLSAAPLPAGASFADQGNGSAIFDWRPAKGQAGSYSVTYTVSDGELSASRAAGITVHTETAPTTPTVPAIESPLTGAQVASLQPALKVRPGGHPQEPTSAVQFELYADEALTDLLDSATVPRAGELVVWALPEDTLDDNTRYWWRARAIDGQGGVSVWANGWFVANLFNDAPEPFTLASPAIGATVTTATPTLVLSNTVDKDGDAVSYGFVVYRDAALADVAASVGGLAPGVKGTTAWTVSPPLDNETSYYWGAMATDVHGAVTETPARPFTVKLGNNAPAAPRIASPVPGATVDSANVALTVLNAADPDGDALTLQFEMDTVNTFDSGDRRVSNPVAQDSAGATSWSATGLRENARHYWRVRANDGQAQSEWAFGEFFVNAVAEPPPGPTLRNPVDGAAVPTQLPALEAHPVVDPDGDAVRYRFQLFADPGASDKLDEGLTQAAAWAVASPLANQGAYYWRVRAEDAGGLASEWSPLASFRVNVVPPEPPSIALTAPDTLIDGRGGSVTVRWEGVDPARDANIALYYDGTGSGYAGALIVDGLKQPPEAAGGSYVWNLAGLPSGSYYVYALIYDAGGTGRAYAPGAVVIPSEVQTGSLKVKLAGNNRTGEDGDSAAINVRLANAPLADVKVDITSSNTGEGIPETDSVTFTPEDWKRVQKIKITGVRDCVRDRNQRYQVMLRVSSLDPNYMAIAPTSVGLVNVDVRQPQATTNDPVLEVCGFERLSRRKIKRAFEFVFRAMLTNSGPMTRGVTLSLTKVPKGIAVREGQLSFAGVDTDETVKSVDTFTIESNKNLKKDFAGKGFKWTVIEKK